MYKDGTAICSIAFGVDHRQSRSLFETNKGSKFAP